MEIGSKMSQILVLCTGFSWFWSQFYFVTQFKWNIICKTSWSTDFVADLSCGGPGSIPRRNTNYFWLLHWFYLINSWKMNLFFLHFLSRYKDCDATTTHRCDHRTIPNWVLLGTLKKKHNFVSTEGWGLRIYISNNRL